MSSSNNYYCDNNEVFEKCEPTDTIKAVINITFTENVWLWDKLYIFEAKILSYLSILIARILDNNPISVLLT